MLSSRFSAVRPRSWVQTGRPMSRQKEKISAKRLSFCTINWMSVQYPTPVPCSSGLTGSTWNPACRPWANGDAGALKSQAGKQDRGFHHILVGRGAQMLPGGPDGAAALFQQNVIAQFGNRHCHEGGTVIAGTGIADIVVGEGGLGLNIGSQRVADAGDHHPCRGLHRDLRVHHHIVRVLVVDHEAGLLMGIIDNGMGGGGSIRGQSCGNAEKGLPEGGAHGLVDVAGLSAADADEGIGDLRKRMTKGDEPSSASSEEAPENSTVQAVMPAA